MTPRADGQIQARNSEVLAVGALEIRPGELYAEVWGRPYRPDERSPPNFGFGYRLSHVFHTPATDR